MGISGIFIPFLILLGLMVLVFLGTLAFGVCGICRDHKKDKSE